MFSLNQLSGFWCHVFLSHLSHRDVESIVFLLLQTVNQIVRLLQEPTVVITVCWATKLQTLLKTTKGFMNFIEYFLLKRAENHFVVEKILKNLLNLYRRMTS